MLVTRSTGNAPADDEDGGILLQPVYHASVIDSHCHLADRKFANDLDAVVSRAAEAGVTHMVTIADSLGEGEGCLEIAEKYEHIFCTIGVHPHIAKEWSDGDGERLQSMLRSSQKVVALGEIGLDYHYMNSPKDIQQRVFAEQLDIARELGLPVVVHNRESIVDLKKILRDHVPLKMVLHCCTERWEDVSGLVEQGYLLSFTGIATYPKSTDIRETISQCPLAQMMIETDAPYLSPQSHRGKRNEPAFVVEVAECIANVKGVSVEQVAAQTTENALGFYSIPSS